MHGIKHDGLSIKNYHAPIVFWPYIRASLIAIIALLLCFALGARVTQAQIINGATIQSPRLTYLDTDQGLDQNTIHDILVDKQGFVWIGTEEGLNRFDGTKVLQVNDINNHIVNSSIYHIFEHSAGQLVLSTSNLGIVSLDLQNKSINTLLAIDSKLAPGWFQDSSSMFEIDNGDMIIGLNEGVYRYSFKTGNAILLFELSNEQIAEGFSIRSVYQHKQVLYIGTNKGLFGKNLNSSEIFTIFSPDPVGTDAANVKLLKSFDKETLFVGTVKGLHAFNLAELDKYITQSWGDISYQTIDEVRNVWDMININDKHYFATDIGLFLIEGKNYQTSFLFQAIKNYEALSSSDILNLSADKAGNLWFGTEYSGAMRWSPNSQRFKNVNNSIFTPDSKKLTNNVVWSIYQYDANNLFIGTNNGLNQYNLSSNSIEHFYTTNPSLAKFSQSEISQISSSEPGYLWLITGDGLRKFDVKAKQYVAINFDNSAINGLFKEFIYSFVPMKNDIYWVLTDNGAFYVDAKNNELTKIDLSSQSLAVADTYKFLGIDTKSKLMLLASAAQLWGINTETLAITQLHSIKAEGTRRSVYPGSFARDNEGVFWLAYPGHGLYKLNGNTFATIAKYASDKYLPTDLVYDVKFDNDGLLWFSSHSGVHRFDTKNLNVQSFGFANGLATSEFNEGAIEVLSDGSFAYGANLGFTMFHPAELKEQTTQIKAPYITEIQLASRKLNMPLTALNDKTIPLHYDDVGLTLYFSALSNVTYSNIKYRYRILSGNKISTYPNLSEGKLLLPALSPGKHTIEINPSGVSNQMATAYLHLDIAHPKLLSPTAYFIYAVLLLVTSMIWYSRRSKIRQLIDNANQQIKQNNKKLTNALNANNAHIWEWDAQTNILKGERLKDLLLNQDKSTQLVPIDTTLDKFIEHIYENDRQGYINAWNLFITSKNTSFDHSCRVILGQNTVKWYRILGNKQKSFDNTKLLSVAGTYSDVTQSITTQNRLKQFSNVFEHTSDWVLIFDSNKTLVASNQSFKKAFNLLDNNNRFKPSEAKVIENQELFYKTLKKLSSLQAGDKIKMEHVVKVGNKNVSLLTNITTIPNELNASIVDSYLIVSTDISEQVAANSELQRMKNFDRLTGLMNRNLFVERLQQSIDYARAHDDVLVLVYFDLNGFKQFNSSAGQNVGDDILKEIAKRLVDFFGDKPPIARVVGDEFAITLENVNTRVGIDKIASQLLKKIASTMTLKSISTSVSANIGIAVLDEACHSADALLSRANLAVNEAKTKGNSRYSYYTESINHQIQSQAKMITSVNLASQGKQFINYYQPIIDLHSGKTIGFEVLLRWPLNGNDKPVKPSDFLAFAEAAGCIENITNQSLNDALTDLAHWRKSGFDGYISFNMYKQHLKGFNFDALFLSRTKFNIPNECIKFEINENLFYEDIDSVERFVKESRQLGYEIALDDFSKTYSSYRFIEDVSVDALIIDRQIIQDMLHHSDARSIASVVFETAERKPITLRTKGIETPEQLDFVIQNKSRYVQGFLFSHPLAFSETIDFLYIDWFETIDIKKIVVKKEKAKVINLPQAPK